MGPWLCPHMYVFLSDSPCTFRPIHFSFFFTSFCLHSGVDSLPLVLKLLCVTQASDLSSSSSFSRMDGVDFKLLYHGETWAYYFLDFFKVIRPGHTCEISTFYLFQWASCLSSIFCYSCSRIVLLWLYQINFIKLKALQRILSDSDTGLLAIAKDKSHEISPLDRRVVGSVHRSAHTFFFSRVGGS